MVKVAAPRPVVPRALSDGEAMGIGRGNPAVSPPPRRRAPAAPRAAARGVLSRIKTADGAFAVDAHQCIVSWSDAATALLGYGPEEVLGRPCYEVMRGRDLRDVPFCRRNCPVMHAARQGMPPPNYDIRATRQDGAPLRLNVSVLLLRSGEAGGPQVLHLLRDVAQRRGLEEAARQVMATLESPEEPEMGSPTVSGDTSSPRRPRLSRREMDALRLLAQGMSNRQIGEALSISPVTARNHVDRLLTKLGVQSRLQAVLFALQNQLL